MAENIFVFPNKEWYFDDNDIDNSEYFYRSLFSQYGYPKKINLSDFNVPFYDIDQIEKFINSIKENSLYPEVRYLQFN